MKTLNNILNLTLFLFIIYSFLYSVNQTIGSDSSVGAAQSTITFDGGNNKISNYALMDGGFIFEDNTTSCSWYSVFKVKEKIDFRKGKLFLFRDLNLSNNSKFYATGFIDGNGYDIVFPASFSDFNYYMPAETVASNINGLSWSFDDSYLSVITDVEAASSLKVYSYDGNNLTFDSQYVNNLPTAYSVRFRPPGLYSGNYHIAMAEQDGGTSYYELRDLIFNTSTGVSLGGGRQYNPDSCHAVAWYYDGLYLAFGVDNSVLKIINVPLSGYINTSTEISASGGATTATQFANDAISWAPAHNNLAAGFDTTLEVYTFDGSSSLIYSTKEVIGQTVSHISWHPSLDYIAVGLDSALNNLRIYDYSFTTSILSEIADFGLTEPSVVNFIDWSPDGKKISLATGQTVKIYDFSELTGFSLYKKIEVDYIVNTVKWSNSGHYIAFGGDGGYLTVYNVISSDDLSVNSDLALTMKDSNLYFKGDFNLDIPFLFEGNCSLDLEENILNFMNDGLILIAPNSVLHIKNATLSNLKDKKIYCYSNNSSLILEKVNLKLSNDYSFEHGSILFSDENIVSGNNIFGYNSIVTSTINTDSILYFSNGTTFSYSPKTAKNNLIIMKDKTSKLFFNGASLISTNTGFRLTTGSLFLDNSIVFSSSGSAQSESICFGNGEVSGDLNVYFFSDAQLNIYGAFCYENIN